MSLVAPLLWTLPFVVPSDRRPGSSATFAGASKTFRPTSPADAPLVSVIIPARNERRNIERCVRSVLSTDYPRSEVIVVDDHSTDGTGEIVRELAARDERLRVIQAPAAAQRMVRQAVGMRDRSRRGARRASCCSPTPTRVTSPTCCRAR